MTLALALALAVGAAAFVAWPIVRPPREPGRVEARPWQGEVELEWEMRLDAAAGRIPLSELDGLRQRIRDAYGARS